MTSRFPSVFPAAALMLGCSLIVSGCSMLGLSSEEAKPKGPRELTKSTSGSTKPQPEIVLLKEAQRNYERGLYSIAHESFQRIKEDYPAGAYADYAAIKAADCLFEQKDFRGAARGYEDIINNAAVKSFAVKSDDDKVDSTKAAPKIASSLKHSDYLLYRAALSHMLLNPGSARDTSRLEKSKELFTRLLADAPKSPYAGLAKEHLTEVEHSLAQTDLALLEYYGERNKDKALTARDLEFKKKYGVEPEVFSEKEKIQEEQPAEEPREDRKAKPPVKSTAAKEPDRFDDAKAESGEANDATTEPSLESEPERKIAQVPRSGRVFISALTCDPASGRAILEVGGDLEAFDESQVVKEQDAGGVQIQSPVARRAPVSNERSDCISTNDLIITSRGEFKFLGADSVSVDMDTQPPQIIISTNSN